LRKLDSKEVLLSADQKKREALLEKFAGSTLVMMLPENTSTNQMLQSYQHKHVQHMRNFETLLEVERRDYQSNFYPRHEGNRDWNMGADSDEDMSRENVVDPHDVDVDLTSDSLSDVGERECVREPETTGRPDLGTANFHIEEPLVSPRAPGTDRPQATGN